MPEDWRITNAERLRGQKLVRKSYHAPSPKWDHDHCAACWKTIDELGEEGAEREAYATTDEYELGAEYEWVCVGCFNELRGVMQWTEVS